MTTPPTADDLAEAKAAAKEADELALDLQGQLYAARRKAKALWIRYDDLVLIAEGQQTLDFDNTSPKEGT